MRDDERKVAAVGHALAVIPFWGILGAAAIWMYYKERSREVVFHAQQAIFFQVALLALAIVFVVVGIFQKIIGMISDSVAGVIQGANVFFLTVCFIVYALVCLYGAYRVWMGYDFLYPIIGSRMAEGYRRSSGE